jgi:hypothetical protein
MARQQGIDDPELNRKLLVALKKTIDTCEDIYARHKVVTFGVIHRKLQELYQTYSDSLDQDSDLKEQEATASGIPIPAPGLVHAELLADEKLVYVRLYHRNMDKFLDPEWQQTWFRPLLDSVKNSERHGLAVFDKADDANLSIKGSQYAYVTLRIKENQDITAQRSPRLDPELKCRLLVIDRITDANIIAFNYQGKSFPVRNGVLNTRIGLFND